MLNKNDVQVLDRTMRSVFGEMLEENNHVLRREIRDEMHSVVNAAVNASEERLSKKIDTLRDDLLEVVSESILPQIDECQRDIVQLKLAVKIA